MPKRKLSDLEGSKPSKHSDTRKLSIKAVRLTVKFEHGVEIILKALKMARGFERQKLSRREKTAKSENNSAALTKLAEEVAALKALDYQTTSERYLFKQLSKTKRIAELPVFKEFAESKNVSTEGPKSTAEANITARLFSSNPVKNALPNILLEIRKLLGVHEAPVAKQINAGIKKDAPLKEKKVQKKQADGDVISGSEEEGPRDSGVADDMSVSGDEESGDEEFSELDARLAPGSDSEEELNSGEGIFDGEKEKPDLDDISDSVSRSSSPVFSEGTSPPPKKAKASKASAAPVTGTTFLPSLMMGGYWSGSESEATDDEQVAGPPKRKNRMGQQARRALWEKKFGASANHVKEQEKKAKNNRDSGWDTRKGATSGRGGRGQGRGGRGDFDLTDRPHNKHSQSSQGASAPTLSRSAKGHAPAKDEGPLHPSWEAKRKLKEKTATTTFSGKKVVFD
ncbi:hypothetical protein N7495_004163 [Penicillium taxi]|uniref:uncharacterized protein n=1 Tax=Penicillium taxi TaxID=168475 RepID=UPI00254530C5|nr:uncharacterized protein N7495_004163 [Penicillium taxi]KAJ5899419.1 hypothetical protein N7495_004163 [Penicillium taxi]